MTGMLNLQLANGEFVTIAEGDTLIIGWSAERGERGAGAEHTEEVLSVNEDTGVVVLRGRRKDRELRAIRGDGKVSLQIHGVI